ncbi:MAG: NAD(P)/FAD-dependent oxidoreductase [Chloroflexota bacterium]
MSVTTRPRVIIVGAGFGGLYAAKTLAGKPIDVLLIDRNNYHTFLPLLYQVATSGLEPEEVAAPVRSIVRSAPNVNFQLGEVTSIDGEKQLVHIVSDGQDQVKPYDYLILSPGSITSYFGLADVQRHSFSLKSLSEAVVLRNHALTMFERAASEPDPNVQTELMTVVVVGGGPTGLETSGALSELFRKVLRKDYPRLDLDKARVILVEATDRLLTAFPESLQRSALDQLQALGVEVLLNKTVAQATDKMVVFKDGSTIHTQTIVWAAGVQAAEIDGLKVELQRGRRMPTLPTLQLTENPCVFVIGDANFLQDETGHAYPQLAPVAMQMGTLAAKNILAMVESQPLAEFRYSDRGIMATIGRSRAVAWVFNKVKLSGYLAWVAWLVLHILYLIGFRNRLNVLVNWTYNYWTWDRGVRIILDR